MADLPALPPDVVALCDHERVAASRLPEAAWAYFQGGAADGRGAGPGKSRYHKRPSVSPANFEARIAAL